MVSKSTLQAGGYVHGIIPKALVSSSNDDEDPGESSKQSGEILRSSEGVGKELLDDDVDGRLTLQIVRSMHEVSGFLSNGLSPRLTSDRES